MIGPTESAADAAIERLAIKAERIARAHAERRLQGERGWRRPDLLWPLATSAD